MFSEGCEYNRQCVLLLSNFKEFGRNNNSIKKLGDSHRTTCKNSKMIRVNKLDFTF